MVNETEQKTQKDSENRLPLNPDKAPSGKIIGILLLIILAVIVNYFLFHRYKEPKINTKEETYNIDAANPITHSTAATASPISQSDDLEKLRQLLVEAKAKDYAERLQASQGATINSPTRSSAVAGEPSEATQTLPASMAGDDANVAFLTRASNSKVAHEYATHFGPLPYVIAQGKFIFGTLSQAVNSDLPGTITAVVSQDIYGQQGRKILVPRGSKLIGEYRSGLVTSQSRLFVVWTRIEEPNGIDIQLGSAGTDALGRAGLGGYVDYHFIDRFGGALLISMIGAGAATIGVNPSDQYNSASAYRSSIASAMSDQGRNMLNQNINIPPTVKLPQGKAIVVIVNRDLDFSRVYQ
jgi:type IV secretion system protein VirB10